MEHSYLLQVLSIALTLALAAGLMVIIAVAISPMISTAELLPLPSDQAATLPQFAAERAPLLNVTARVEDAPLPSAYRAVRSPWDGDRMPNAAMEASDRPDNRSGRGAAEAVRESA